MTIEEFEATLDRYKQWNSKRAFAGKGYKMLGLNIEIDTIFDLCPTNVLMVEGKLVSQRATVAQCLCDAAAFMERTMKDEA